MQQLSPIRVGIIGLGAIGERLLQAFLKHTEIEIVAVCDAAKGRAQLISQSLNGTAWYTDHKEMLLHTDVDLVYVAVPPKYHHAIALNVIASGKHILCEKPLANSITEAHEMLELAQRAGIVHAMNFPSYYRNVFKEISNYVSSGYVGQLRRVEIITHFHKWPREWQQNDWVGGREQGGFVLEVIPHFIQMTHALFGNMEVIQAQLELPDDPSKCEIGILGSIKLGDGTPVLVNGVSQIAQQEHLSFTIYGTNGTVSLVNWSKLEVGKYGEPLKDVSVQPNDNVQELITNMVSAIRGEHTDLIDFQTGYEIQEVIEALLQKSNDESMQGI